MPDYIKNTTLQELREKYSEHHGFVFFSSNKSSDPSIETLANVLRNQGITRDFPLLVTRLKEGIVFVYEHMDGPRFWHYAERASQIMGINTMPLYFFLRDAKD